MLIRGIAGLIWQDVIFKHFPEMEPVDGAGDGERKFAWLFEQRPEEQLPVLNPFFSYNAKPVD
jgi:hypothetical protein